MHLLIKCIALIYFGVINSQDLIERFGIYRSEEYGVNTFSARQATEKDWKTLQETACIILCDCEVRFTYKV